MIPVTAWVTGVVVLAPLCWLLADYYHILRLRKKMPPGPFPLPLVGNFFDIPKSRPWIEWEKWSDTYKSPMITLWNGHRPIIMCNDIWCISDLLDKRAAIYSSRPHFVVMGDMMNMSKSNQVCQVYGDTWRLHRRLMHTAVGSQAVRNYRTDQSNESKILMRDLLNNPAGFEQAIERYSCSVVSIIGWGRRVDRMHDTVAQVAMGFMEGVNYVIPGLYIMEAIPWLAKLPSWIYSLPSAIYNGTNHMHRYFTAISKEAATEGLGENFSKRLVKAQEEHGISDEDISSLTANMIGGGVDTTSSSTITLVLAMCAFPDVQRKAQEELDRVVGRDRYPDWSDEESLPYIRAVDTAITGNLWAIHRNPRDFPEPDVFRPERFLGGLERPYPNKKGHNAFGWGRRQCSGQPLAEQGLFITFARLLWSFNMEPGVDDMGRPAKLDIFAYTESENMRPEPFRARFTPRSAEIEAIILGEASNAREALRHLDWETKVTMASVA
ncbi:cytochrome P450 [Plectosphaerella plurivora]|uniref:Cytochrome P450 n=1 Tax=Plectosphaerella plurivora TaxID=936078 RepID=A0A9P8V9Y6_9PEZI|nr:cytochrome P450 [Plectosphaerella plurivora]